MGKILKGFIAFILVAIIVAGLGYIGYSNFFMNGVNQNVGMNTNNTMNMTNGSDNNTSNMNMQNQQGNAMIVDTVKGILGNKEGLDNAIAALNDSLTSLTLDPYSPSKSTAGDTNTSSQSGNMNGMSMSSGAAMPETAANPDTATNNVNGSTTINIYPANNNAANAQGTSAPTMTMKDMGTRYDANKMEQLHSGLYKLSVGMQLLDQLNNELQAQAEVVRTANTNDPAQYYTNQYTLLLQNRNKLSEALNYINQAANLVNINPYVSDNGLVYDKDRMASIHDSIFKMARGVALLNQLNDDLLKQALNASVSAQNAINSSSMSSMSSQMNQGNMSPTNGLFGNINFPSIINIILIVFVALFILGLIGAVASLFKTPQQNVNK